MLIINLQNIEELIFYNKAVQQALPEFKDIFASWSLGKRFPKMAYLCPKAVFDLLEKLDEEHIQKLEIQFKDKIKIVKTDTHLVRENNFDLDCVNCEINDCIKYDNWFVWRNADKIYIGEWR